MISFQTVLRGQSSVGFEFQVYPTGIMPGLRGDFALSSRDALNIRVGANLFNHRDMGVQDRETGSGFGGTIGYRRYFSDQLSDLFLGIRNDIWRNTVNWTDQPDTPQETTGTTKIVVIQPTLEAGYMFLTANGKLGIAPALGFGYEVNVVSEGRDVGQGPILLLGVSFNLRK